MAVPLALCGLSFPGFVNAQTMMVPGELNVTPSGALEYSVPISVPPGTSGMAPKLSFNYSSQGGNGYLGVGWSLGGLPAITRCGSTIAQDGVTRGVDLGGDDLFCMDGQKLVVVSGGYGENNAEYRTEIDGFSKIVSYRDTSVGVSSGPTSFRVWTKSGQVIDFGDTSVSRVVATNKPVVHSWLVNKISDVVGNYVEVNYDNIASTGEVRPLRVDYTGNDAASLAPYASVRFEYESRTDDLVSYKAGAQSSTASRLKYVSTFVGSDEVLQYVLDYTTSAQTGRSILHEIKLCSSSSGTLECLPATNFSMKGAPLDFASAKLDRLPPNFMKSGSGYQVRPADWDGDGNLDILLWHRNGGHNKWYLGDGAGNFTGHYFSIPVSSMECDGESGDLHIGNWNKDDGLPDFVCHRDGSFFNLFINQSTPGNLAFGLQPSGVPYSIYNNNNFDFLPADWNGDGVQDAFFFNYKNGENYGYQNAGGPSYFSQSFVHFNAADLKRIPYSAGRSTVYGNRTVMTSDWSGDGVSDFYIHDNPSNNDLPANQRWHVGDGNSGFTLIQSDNVTSLQDIANHDENFSLNGRDLNGDGLPDHSWTRNSTGLNSFGFGRGDGTYHKVTNPISTSLIQGGGHVEYFHEDFDGDGIADLLRYDENPGDNKFFFGRGYGDFSAAVSSIIPPFEIDDDGSFIPGDFNGDGATDLLWYRYQNGHNRLYLSEVAQPDLLISVTTGLGSTTTIAYKAGTDPSVYQQDTGVLAASYPMRDITAPMSLVSRVSADDGIDGSYYADYRYAGGKVDLHGRGFLGFREFTAEDVQTGIEQTQTFRQDFPYIGALKTDVKAVGGVELMRTTNSHLATNTQGGTSVVFPYISQSVKESADLNGTAFPTSTTQFVYDAFGNATDVTVSTPDGASKVTTSTYVNDVAQWHLGRLMTSTVTSTVPGTVPDGADATGQSSN